MLRESALEFLKTRDAKVGETVQLGWFVFRIVDGQNGIDLESLDFQEVASFTSDFQVPDQIHLAQRETLKRLGVDELACTLSDPALVSRSYQAGGANAFIERCSPTSESDSGWYVGVVDETLDFTDADSFIHQSLYELTIHDERFARFWLFPVGYRIYFDNEEPRIEEVNKSQHPTA
jgi:hypothetical protein